MPVPTITLNDGYAMPQVGFGVFKIPEDETRQAVEHALDTGYRSIDTAALYGNEHGVGRAIAESGLDRDDLFITTKVWNTDQGYDATIAACRRSLELLGLDAVDLYLIHWPMPQTDRYVDTWRALLALRDEGLITSVGVSNFEPEHLRRVVAETGVVPAVNQVELHPWLQQHDVRDACRELSVAVEAWSPLGKARHLDDPVLTSIAGRVGRTTAQVMLRWQVQLGHIVIPKSVNPERMQQNIALFDFELSDDDVTAIAGLHDGSRTGPDPMAFD